MLRPMVRYGFEELEAIIKARGRRVTELRLSGSKVAELRRTGLTEVEADRYAVRVGVMPHEVWAGWYDAVDQVCGPLAAA